MKDEWFRGICETCKQNKDIHNDPMDKFNDPVTVICKECEDKRTSFLNKYFMSVNRVNT